MNLIVLMVVTVGLISIATLKITASSILREKITSGNILVSSIQSTIDSIFRGDPESFQKGTEGLRLARLSHSFAKTSELNSLLIIDREHRVMADSGNVADGAVIEWKDLDEAMSGGRVITRFGNTGKWLFWGMSDELIVFAPIYLGGQDSVRYKGNHASC